jgi:hypothetical protein
MCVKTAVSAYVFWLLTGLEWKTYHTLKIPIAVCAARPEDEQVVLETCKKVKFTLLQASWP